MNWIWIFVGVFYIIYKLQREEKIFTAKGLLIALGFFAWAFLPWLICKYVFGDSVADIVCVISYGLPLFILAIYEIISNILCESERKKDTAEKNDE